MPAAPFVELDGLTFRYRRASEPAIRDVSLAIGPGEILLVAGPSGGGKSTLVRAINGLIPHAYPGELRGSVRIEGRPTTDLRLRDIALSVGTVLQDPAKQILGATVETELAFGPENLGLAPAQIRERIRDVVSRAGIEHLSGRETAALSGGERQLLAIAGILMMLPRVYVVDEPLANLDPATAARLLAILRALVDEGHAVIIVEHRVEEALELRPDRVLYLDEGRVQYLGDADGFLEVADPSAVRLPFEVVLRRTREALERASPREARPKEDETIAAGGSGSDDQEAAGAPQASRAWRLEFDGVHAGYGGREVLRGVQARLGRHETVAVLGPNGSGKTTLFKTAMNLLRPSAGDVLVDGMSTRTLTVAQLATTFGYVFQSPSQMLFARTVREELLFGRRNLHRDEALDDQLIADVLRRTSLDDIEGILERPPLTLSFGQQKRLALAIALSLEPSTLILDEPSAGQDHRTAARFMAAVAAITGLESLYLVTHDVDLALTHADRILLLRDGRIVADGPPSQVIEDEDRWIALNLRPTSLMRANARRRGPDRRFLDAERLALSLLANGSARGPRQGKEVRSSTLADDRMSRKSGE
ncbi:MAG TPA: ABC transporter ATP-binding protein [Candidatus Limnocylindrales bacterium]|jgi:energy-coupling factor transport system ATP-binding protein|nr:ABC transporter ATP-binding protein [Candidatus Limnocylindrales bacterium]